MAQKSLSYRSSIRPVRLATQSSNLNPVGRTMYLSKIFTHEISGTSERILELGGVLLRRILKICMVVESQMSGKVGSKSVN
jgi:hypothetical protein